MFAAMFGVDAGLGAFRTRGLKAASADPPVLTSAFALPQDPLGSVVRCMGFSGGVPGSVGFSGSSMSSGFSVFVSQFLTSVCQCFVQHFFTTVDFRTSPQGPSQFDK